MQDKEKQRIAILAWRRRNRARLREQDKKWRRTRPKRPLSMTPAAIRRRERRASDPALRAKFRGYKKTEREKAPHKEKARHLTKAAIADGRLIPGPCRDCGVVGVVEAHHEDYSIPLDVIWLCPVCHRKLHKAMRAKAA